MSAWPNKIQFVTITIKTPNQSKRIKRRKHSIFKWMKTADSQNYSKHSFKIISLTKQKNLFSNVHINQEAAHNWRYYKFVVEHHQFLKPEISPWSLSQLWWLVNFTHSKVLTNRSCWFQETIFKNLYCSKYLFFSPRCIKFRIKSIKEASTSDLTFRGSMWQGSPW